MWEVREDVTGGCSAQASARGLTCANASAPLSPMLFPPSLYTDCTFKFLRDEGKHKETKVTDSQVELEQRQGFESGDASKAASQVVSQRQAASQVVSQVVSQAADLPLLL